MDSPIYHYIAEKLPWLRLKLETARMNIRPEEFIKKNIKLALILGGFLAFIFAMFMGKGDTQGILTLLRLIGITLLIFPITSVITFFYLINIPTLKIEKERKSISREVVFATRFTIIELESGISLYNALINLGYNYEYIGRYTDEIVDKVRVGTPIEEAFNEAIEVCPSADLRRIFWQILNSIKTGANVADSLKAALEQIIKSQQIEIKEYSRKLNPLSMFYMMFAVIIPSLGMTMLMILSTFIGMKLTLPILLGVTLTMGFIQYMFLAVINSTRPAIDL